MSPFDTTNEFADDPSLTMTERLQLFLQRAGRNGASMSSMRYFFSKEEAERPGRTEYLLSNLVKTERAFTRGPHGYFMYFGQHTWAMNWVEPPHHKDMLMAQRKLNRINQRTATDKEKKHREKLKTPAKLLKDVVLEGPVINNVKVQVIPTLVDYRYHVPTDFVGQFQKEWRTKRRSSNNKETIEG